MGQLVALLENSIKTKEGQILEGNAPTPYCIGIEPPVGSDSRSQVFPNLMGMNAVLRLYSSIHEVHLLKQRNQTSPYRIDNPKEVALAFGDSANATYQAMTGALSEFYIFTSGTTQTMNQTIRRSDLHSLFLGALFNGIKHVNQDVMKKIDALLTSFVTAVKDFAIDSTQPQPSIDHCIIINYMRENHLTGSEGEAVLEATTRLIYIKITTDSWKQAVHKPAGFLHRNDKFNFVMEYTVSDRQLNIAKYLQAKPRWEKVMEPIASEGSQKFHEIISQQGIEGLGREMSSLFKYA